MKKTILSFLTVTLFVCGTLFSISYDSGNGMSFLKKGHSEQLSLQNRHGYDTICPDGTTHILTCGVGSESCTPSGTCPSN